MIIVLQSSVLKGKIEKKIFSLQSYGLKPILQSLSESMVVSKIL